ncbi:MAG TPA: DUF2935 domain-containing protein [Clostridia bacterium]|nr:DUF2935 domain-containing protein [Clostridia bacterium]
MVDLLEEIRFWTGIMRDHGEFILTSLSYNEQEAIQYSAFYKERFSQLHEASLKLTNSDDLQPIINECINTLTGFINFKRLLLSRLLQCGLNSSLTPTFYNHMINEAMDFYRTLTEIPYGLKNKTIFDIFNLHKVWLVDASGHAAILAADLDPTEKALINEARSFEKRFTNLSIKSEELGKMLVRTGLGNGHLSYFNEEVVKTMNEFISYLEKLRQLSGECRILGIIKPLTPDHMIREETHYLNELY